MSQQAKGEARSLKINVEVAWHEGFRQPLVSLQLGDGGMAISPEAAINLGLTLIATAHGSLHEAHLRTFLGTTGMDSVQVVAALVNYRKLAESRTKRRAQEMTQAQAEVIHLHDVRVAATGGDASKAFETQTCELCGAQPGVACDKEK